jgi:Tfp pilus assembly protein PilN
MSSDPAHEERKMAQIEKANQTHERVMSHFLVTHELLHEVWRWNTGLLEELKGEIPNEARFKDLHQMIDNRMAQ